ncbi:Pollen-specific protein SF3 [Platanthera guangdongensis]|uniref:Pollen-specific protein SF3 n=1 Tax=Platanthera guangdongensis TaxID=2320717 RepID=A0ABR2M2M9_9ASPA
MKAPAAGDISDHSLSLPSSALVDTFHPPPHSKAFNYIYDIACHLQLKSSSFVPLPNLATTKINATATLPFSTTNPIPTHQSRHRRSLFSAASSQVYSETWKTRPAASEKKREEELLRRDMASSAFGGTTQKCTACGKTVYLVDELVADNRFFHRACFRCYHCKGTLKVSTITSSSLFAILSFISTFTPFVDPFFGLEGILVEVLKGLQRIWRKDHISVDLLCH